MTQLQPSTSGSSSAPQEPPQASPAPPTPNLLSNANASANAEPQQRQQGEVDKAEIDRARAANEQALRDSREGVWFLKEITFDGERKKIVTQNYNGPCSFIAICNILILRGDIQILPSERTSVSYDFLAQLVGEYLLHASPDVDLSAALTMMPLTQKGMDLNPLFTSPTAFHPHGENGALKLFEQANIPLIHGWLADPTSPEYPILSRIDDYDSAVNLIVEADSLTKGQLVYDESVPGPSSHGPSNGHDAHVHISDNWSPEDRKKVEDALVVRNFLEHTSSQLTYHGLFTLASSIQPGSLVALFRNSHLSVLHRRASPSPSSQGPSNPSSSTSLSQQPSSNEDSDPALYNLVTDYVFYNEPSVVWERLEDVDGASSTFVDSDFHRSAPVGGDFAGATAHEVVPGAFAEFDPADQELARRLQAEEDARAQEAYARQYAQQPQQPQHQRGLGGGGRHAQFDPRDPRNQAYMQQQAYVQQQQQQAGGEYSDQGARYLEYLQRGEGQHGRKAFKVKRKSDCVVM